MKLICVVIGVSVALCMILLITTIPIYGQQQDNNTTNTFVQVLKEAEEAEELQKQQERILNITKLWEEADLIDFDRDEYNPLYMPAVITYQSNNTVVLFTDQSGGGGTRFWGAVEILKGQGFEVTDIMIIPDEMMFDTYTGDYDVWSDTKVLLERPNQ